MSGGMLPRPEPRSAFKRELRARLMAQAPGILARETTWSRFRGSLLLRPAMVAAAITLLVIGGAGRAAAGSLPGDAAYPLKIAAEQVQLALALDDGTRLAILSQQADHRLAELAESVSDRRGNTSAAEDGYAKAVNTLTAAVDAVRTEPNVTDDKKTAAEDVVDAAHQKHELVLDDLSAKVSGAEQPEIERARLESNKLHAAGLPVRTPTPTARPDRSRTPASASPSRTPEQRIVAPTRTPSASPSRTPGTQSEHPDTPEPTVRP
jgi:hypothetical protein